MSTNASPPLLSPHEIHHSTLSQPAHHISTHIHPNPAQTLLPQLNAHLPHTLPLARRLQFAIQTPHALALATFAPSAAATTTTSSTTTTTMNPAAAAPTLPDLSATRGEWAALYADRSRAPETEAWVYVSAEADVNGGRALGRAARERARRLVLALLEHVRRVSFADVDGESEEGGGRDGDVDGDGSLRREDGVDVKGGRPPQLGAYLRDAQYGGPDPRLMLVGTVHGATLEMLAGRAVGAEEGAGKVISGVQMQGAVGIDPDRKTEWGARPDEDGSGDPWFDAPRGVVRGHTCPYAKFVFPPGSSKGLGGGDGGGDVASGREGLPEGMGWSRVREGELGLVMSRTAIPRKERTLRLLPDVGIRLDGDGDGEGRLIAWGFLGVDSSLTSLHVEEEFRGKGLAKTLTKRVFGLLRAKEEVGDGDGFKGFMGVEEGQDYLHSDVAKDNKPSVGVAQALGGVDSWDCYWTWVDLDAVQKAVASAVQVLS